MNLETDNFSIDAFVAANVDQPPVSNSFRTDGAASATIRKKLLLPTFNKVCCLI